MTSRFVIAMLLAGALALACGPLARSSDSPQRDAQAAPMPKADGESPLATSVNVTVEDQVTLGLHLTNRTDRRLELSFRSGQTHDFIILDSAGREVWRWSQGRMFTQAMQNRMVGSRETLSWEERWDPRGHTGAFTLIAHLTSSTHPVEEAVEFELP